MVKYIKKGGDLMRIPFLKKEITVEQDRLNFIRHSHGGSAMLLSGGIFWLIAGIIAMNATPTITANVYLYGGMIVPILGFIIAKLLQSDLMQPSKYTSLVILASGITTYGMPILFLVNKYNPLLIAPVLAILNGGHLFILMWIHLDYIYFLLALAELIVGITFIFSFPAVAPVYVGLLLGLISIFAGIFVYIASKNPLKGYNIKIEK
jgi:hypothetical protein